MQLKVALLHNTVTPYRLPLFEELSKHYELNVIFCERQTSDRKWTTSLKGTHFKSTILSSRRLGWIVINGGLVRALKSKAYDIYLLADNNEDTLSIVLFVLMAKLRRKPIIIWNEHVEDKMGALKRSGVIYRMWKFAEVCYRRWLYKQATAFLSMSGSYTDEYLLNKGVSKEKIFTNTQIMPRSLLPAPDKKKPFKFPYLLYLGYFRAEKDLPTLIGAWQSVKDTHGVQLILVGTGPEETKLKQLSANSQTIHIIGYMEGQKKAALLSNADALLLPSLYEPWGLVVNESLYYGTPVICSDAVAASSIVNHGENGLIIRAGEQSLLAQNLQRLVGDKSLQKHLKKSAAFGDKRVLYSTALGTEHFIKAIQFTSRGFKARSKGKQLPPGKYY
jgi:glycosyltransferase involved in cell wall biosynthesis